MASVDLIKPIAQRHVRTVTRPPITEVPDFINISCDNLEYTMGPSKGVAIIVIARGTSRTFRGNGGEFDLSVFNSTTHKRVYVENFKNVVKMFVTVTNSRVSFGAGYGPPDFYDWDDDDDDDDEEGKEKEKERTETGGCGGSFEFEKRPEIFIGIELLHRKTTLVEII